MTEGCKMTKEEYLQLINDICRTSWNLYQIDRYGNWDSQPNKIKIDYFKELYESYKYFLG